MVDERIEERGLAHGTIFVSLSSHEAIRQCLQKGNDVIDILL